MTIDTLTLLGHIVIIISLELCSCSMNVPEYVMMQLTGGEGASYFS